eukprot:292189-Chlamydomonas_euryale.AAC.1
MAPPRAATLLVPCRLGIRWRAVGSAAACGPRARAWGLGWKVAADGGSTAHPDTRPAGERGCVEKLPWATTSLGPGVASIPIQSSPQPFAQESRGA